MATQAQIGPLQSILCASVANAVSGLSYLSTTDMEVDETNPVPQLFAQVLEFVAVPGQKERLEREIPMAMRRANRNCKGYCGCLLLFSEQEARLVTLVTLWKDTAGGSEWGANSKRFKALLGPYVDRWLRARNFISFFSVG